MDAAHGPTRTLLVRVYRNNLGGWLTDCLPVVCGSSGRVRAKPARRVTQGVNGP